MRLVTMRTGDGTRAGRVDGDTVVELAAADVGALLAAGPDWREVAAAGDGPRHALDTVDLAPVLPAPSKIICLGFNYRSHIEETGRTLPEHPAYFAKFARALVGPRDPIVLPAASDRADWEVELAVVIGTPARHVARDDVDAHIAGLTVANDVSIRDWQYRSSQFLAGKNFESTTPLGPALVTLDEVPTGGNDIALTCEVDGEVVQRGRTSELHFGIADIITDLSRVVTLDPGDVILTGTPSGVGHVRTPPVFLAAGQVVRCAIEHVGELVNECVAERPPAT